MKLDKKLISFLIINLFVLFSMFSYTIAMEQSLDISIRNDALLQEEDIKIENNIEGEYSDSIFVEEIYRLVELNSIKLKQAEYDLEQAEELYEEVKGLKTLKPTDKLPYTDSIGNTIIITDSNNKLQMEISKEITYYQAENGVKLSERNIELEKNNLKHEVTDLLISFAKASEGLTLANQNVDRAEQFKEITNSQYKQGLVAKTSALDSEIALTQAKIGLQGAETQLQISRENVFSAIGINYIDGLIIDKIEPSDAEYELTIEQIDNLLTFAFANRLDYLMQKDLTDYEKKRYEIYDEHYTYYGNKQDKIREQEIIYEKEKLNQLALERSINLQIYQAILGFNQAVDQLQSLEKSVEQAKESLNITELRYEAGLGTTYEVLSSRVALLQAENTLLDGKYQVMTVKNNLEKAISGSIEQYIEFDS